MVQKNGGFQPFLPDPALSPKRRLGSSWRMNLHTRVHVSTATA
jgi:hypothetical protein